MLETPLPSSEAKMLHFFGSEKESKEFQQCSSFPEKITRIWKVPLMQELLKKSGKQVSQKSEGESRRNREIGNKHFQAGKWSLAASYFSKAIAFAYVNDKQQGRDLSLAIANRSAALYRLEKYKLALEDIDYALDAGYPQDIRYKVFERRVYCLIGLGRLEEAKKAVLQLQADLGTSTLEEKKKVKIEMDANEELKKGMSKSSDAVEEEAEPWLKLPTMEKRHPTLPAFSSALELKYDEKKGRHVIANRDIECGEVLVIENPATACLYYDKREEHCDNCFKYIPLRQIPCDHCSALRFCGFQCKKSAIEGYHQFECGREDVFESVIGQMMQEGKTNAKGTKKFHRMALKTVTQKSLAWFLKNKDKLLKVHNSTLSFRDEYEGVARLVGHHERMPQTRIFAFLMSSIFHLRNLQQAGYFGVKKNKVFENLTEEELLIGELLYTFLEKMQFNTHSVTQGEPDKQTDFENGLLNPGLLYENRIRCIGNAVYPSLAMLNHSCYTNIYKFFVGPTVVAVACQKIPVGNEISENYFPVVQILPRPERRSWLSQSYWFDCSCTGCLQNLPNIQNSDTIPTHLRCERKECSGIVTEHSCRLCSKKMDRELRISEIQEVWARLKDLRKECHSNAKHEELLKLEKNILQKYIRLQELLSLPCRIMYEAEVLYWRAVRLAHGSRSY
ncbi:SET and MYND domain-containing protein 4 [Eurytemora carolleeae]|uniref:SET and MYND domain-containing protein 4 n=1 Tax=Eurytemora carolleeae TaxID=1294199 RepID=UPI000C794B8D|nr:SET and MYND domain-containing protein 4 [Eurytemora carolleeae]|eukprot:XP_023342115.1 SET and MYND domain-containing protein 4-like [Eurytemora affinis]